MNTAELNKLKKSELVNLSAKLQHEQSELTDAVATLRSNEADLKEVIAILQNEKSDLEELVASLTAEKQQLERKYGKAKQLLRASKSAADDENLRIKKPAGQVDRDYNLHEAMTGGGKLEVSTDTYRRVLEFVRKGVDKAGMDKMALWKDQNPALVGDIMAAARETFPFLNHYVNTWPITDIIHRYLTNFRKHEIAKQKKAAEVEAAEGADSSNDGNTAPVPPGTMGGDSYDDVELSD